MFTKQINDWLIDWLSTGQKYTVTAYGNTNIASDLWHALKPTSAKQITTIPNWAVQFIKNSSDDSA